MRVRSLLTLSEDYGWECLNMCLLLLERPELTRAELTHHVSQLAPCV